MIAASAGSPAGEARAQSTDLEIGPWLGWAAGVEWRGGRRRDVAYLNTGFDATAIAGGFGGGYGGAVEVRLGPWLALHLPADRHASGEGGLTLIVTQTQHASWGTYGIRFGGGYGADREAHIVGTLWGGVRYVPFRAGQAPPGLVSKATGIRVVATVRRTLGQVQGEALVFGIEFEPDYFLPPYSLFKWGGKH